MCRVDFFPLSLLIMLVHWQGTFSLPCPAHSMLHILPYPPPHSLPSLPTLQVNLELLPLVELWSGLCAAQQLG